MYVKYDVLQEISQDIFTNKQKKSINLQQESLKILPFRMRDADRMIGTCGKYLQELYFPAGIDSSGKNDLTKQPGINRV